MKSHHVDLLNEAIAPALTRLALPIMATSLVQMLYNLTDMAWIGRLGAGAVTAVGSAGMYTWFSQGFAILARTGGQVKTAHCLGAGENDSAAQYARGALQLGILFAVLYGLVSLFGASRLIGFFKLNSPEVIAQAEWYVRIACGLVIFSYLNAILTGLLTAAGNSRTPFIVNVAGLVFNVVLDPVLTISGTGSQRSSGCDGHGTGARKPPVFQGSPAGKGAVSASASLGAGSGEGLEGDRADRCAVGGAEPDLRWNFDDSDPPYHRMG